MKKQDGVEYKPNEVNNMVNNCLHALNTEARNKALKNNQQFEELKMGDLQGFRLRPLRRAISRVWRGMAVTSSSSHQCSMALGRQQHDNRITQQHSCYRRRADISSWKRGVASSSGQGHNTGLPSSSGEVLEAFDVFEVFEALEVFEGA
jgi:hypothetical protein